MSTRTLKFMISASMVTIILTSLVKYTYDSQKIKNHELSNRRIDKTFFSQQIISTDKHIMMDDSLIKSLEYKYDSLEGPFTFKEESIVIVSRAGKYGYINLTTGYKTGIKYSFVFEPVIYGDNIIAEVTDYKDDFGIINLSNGYESEVQYSLISSPNIYGDSLIVKVWTKDHTCGYIDLKTGTETGTKYLETFTPELLGGAVLVKIKDAANNYGLVKLNHLEELFNTEFATIEVIDDDIIVATRLDNTIEICPFPNSKSTELSYK